MEGPSSKDKVFVLYPKFMENHHKFLKNASDMVIFTLQNHFACWVVKKLRGKSKAGKTVIAVDQARNDGGLAWSGNSRMVRNGQGQITVQKQSC